VLGGRFRAASGRDLAWVNGARPEVAERMGQARDDGTVDPADWDRYVGSRRQLLVGHLPARRREGPACLPAGGQSRLAASTRMNSGR